MTPSELASQTFDQTAAVHLRMDQATRAAGRPGRHFFSEASNFGGGGVDGHAALNDSDTFGQAAGSPNLCNEAPATHRRGSVSTQEAGIEPGPSPNPFGQHEVKTPDRPEAYLLALWHAADRRKLNPLFEKRSGQSRFLVHCSAVDWAFIQTEALAS